MYLNHIHNFRTIAIIGIVGAHALHNFDWTQSPTTFLFFDTLFNQSSIWFFFIAGLLFQYLSKRYETKKYYISKVKNVVVPYLILSIPALVASVSFVAQEVPVDFYQKPVAEQVLLFLLTGKHLAPFWFVPTISIIYLGAPFLIKTDRAVWPYWALFILIPISAYLGRDGFLILTGLNGYYSPVSKAIYLFSVYFFGMFCGRFQDEALIWARRWHLPLLIIATAIFTANVLQIGRAVTLMYLFKLVTCPLLMYYLTLKGTAVLNRLAIVGALSFGIFFIHGYLLAATKMGLDQFVGTATLPASLPGYIVYVLAITVVCTAILYVGQKLLGARSRLVLGA